MIIFARMVIIDFVFSVNKAVYTSPQSWTSGQERKISIIKNVADRPSGQVLESRVCDYKQGRLHEPKSRAGGQGQ